MPTKAEPKPDAKETMQSLLRHLKRSENELFAALSLFKQFPKATKNGARRMDALFKALHSIQKHQFDLPRDWQQSQWYRPEDHDEFLAGLEDEVRQSN